MDGDSLFVGLGSRGPCSQSESWDACGSIEEEYAEANSCADMYSTPVAGGDTWNGWTASDPPTVGIPFTLCRTFTIREFDDIGCSGVTYRTATSDIMIDVYAVVVSLSDECIGAVGDLECCSQSDGECQAETSIGEHHAHAVVSVTTAGVSSSTDTVALSAVVDVEVVGQNGECMTFTTMTAHGVSLQFVDESVRTFAECCHANDGEDHHHHHHHHHHHNHGTGGGHGPPVYRGGEDDNKEKEEDEEKEEEEEEEEEGDECSTLPNPCYTIERGDGNWCDVYDGPLVCQLWKICRCPSGDNEGQTAGHSTDTIMAEFVYVLEPDGRSLPCTFELTVKEDSCGTVTESTVDGCVLSPSVVVEIYEGSGNADACDPPPNPLVQSPLSSVLDGECVCVVATVVNGQGEFDLTVVDVSVGDPPLDLLVNEEEVTDGDSPSRLFQLRSPIPGTPSSIRRWSQVISADDGDTQQITAGWELDVTDALVLGRNLLSHVVYPAWSGRRVSSSRRFFIFDSSHHASPAAVVFTVLAATVVFILVLWCVCFDGGAWLGCIRPSVTVYNENTHAPERELLVRQRATTVAVVGGASMTRRQVSAIGFVPNLGDSVWHTP
jgi:hypothetical protein